MKKLELFLFGGDNEVFLGRDFTKSRNFSEELGSKIDKEIKNSR